MYAGQPRTGAKVLGLMVPHGSLTLADAPLIDAKKLFRQPGPALRICHTEENMQKLSSVLFAILISISIIAVARESMAQSSEAPLPQKGTRLLTLGTRAGPVPTVGRAQSSNLLIVNGTLYVVDAGPGVTRRLTRAGISIRDIDNIFITHAHSDHTGGLGELLTAEYNFNRTKPVNIYGPPGIETLVKSLIQTLSIYSDLLISDGRGTVPVAKVFFGHDTGTGAIYQDANVKVTAAENTHFNFPPGTPAYGKYKSYAYRFETPDRVVVFTGDTGPSAAVTELAKGADMLVSEVMSVDEWKERQIKIGRWQSMTPEQQAASFRHMTQEHLTPDEVGKMAARAGVKTVVLTHLPVTADPKDDYKRFGEQVKKHFSGQVLIAKDLMEF
jgi:ribonuclease BN (tRNA processing enzyme)